MQTSHKDAPTMRFTSTSEHMAKPAKHLYWCLWAIKLLIEPQTKITRIVHLHCCTQNICGYDSCDNIISWSGVFVTFCSLHLAQMWTAVVKIQEKHPCSCGAANETQGQNTEGQRKSSVINTRPQFEFFLKKTSSQTPVITYGPDPDSGPRTSKNHCLNEKKDKKTHPLVDDFTSTISALKCKVITQWGNVSTDAMGFDSSHQV